MIYTKQFDAEPENTLENVLEIIEARLNRERNEAIPELLLKFSTLLGNEKEKWGGVETIKVCIEELKKGHRESKNHQKDSEECQDPKDDQIHTVKDLDKFLFSPNRYIPIVIPELDSPNTRKVVSPGASNQTSAPPANPIASKATSKGSGSDTPSTSAPPANPKTFKVKIYMGNGWDRDLPNLLNRRHPPSLWVKINVEGDKSQENEKSQENDKSQKNDKSKKKYQNKTDDNSQKTKVQKTTWTPCWGEEFEFSLSSPEDSKLNLEVCDSSKNEFAGKTCVAVSELKPGIHVITLSDSAGKPYSSTWLLMRFML